MNVRFVVFMAARFADGVLDCGGERSLFVFRRGRGLDAIEAHGQTLGADSFVFVGL